MGCVHLLDTLQLLKHWNQIGQCHFLFYMLFMFHFKSQQLITEGPALQ